MINNILFLFSLLIPLVIGGRLLSFFDVRRQLFASEKFFYAFGLGFGAITLSMLCFSILGIGFKVVMALFLLAVFFVLIEQMRRNHLRAFVALLKSKLGAKLHCRISPFVLVSSLFVILNILVVTARTMFFELDLWDSWAFWAFKAKVFYYHGIIPLSLFPKFVTVWGNWDYPMHVPLMEAWAASWVGFWNDHQFRLIFPIHYAGICAVIFNFLRQHVPEKAAWAAMILAVTLFGLQRYTIGTMAEPILLFYYLASFSLLIRWAQQGDRRILLLSAVFAGLTTWVKLEGGVLIFGNFVFLFLYKLKGYPATKFIKLLSYYFVIVLAVSAPWAVFKSYANIYNEFFSQNRFLIENIPDYIESVKFLPQVYRYHFFNFAIWNIAWPLLITAIFYNLLVKKDKSINFILVVLLTQLLIFSCGAAVTLGQESIIKLDTMERFLLGPGLLAIIFSSLALFTDKSCMFLTREESKSSNI